MNNCVACGANLSTNDAVVLPASVEKRKLFAVRLGFDESYFLNLPVRRYLCREHFNPNDFYRNQHGHITGLRRLAVPIAVSSSSSSRPPISPTAQTPSASSISSYRHPVPPHRPRLLPPFISKFINFNPHRTRIVEPHNVHNLPLTVQQDVPPTLPPQNILTSSPTNIVDDFDMDIDSGLEAAPKPQRKKRGPYKKYQPRIADFNEAESSIKEPLMAEEEAEVDETDDERIEMVLISKDRLLELFSFCPKCKSTLGGNIKKEFRVIGTAGSITYKCPKCPKSRQIWTTQERIPGKKVFRGNALLSAAAHITPISFPSLKQLFNLARISIFGSARYKLSQKDVVWPVVGNAFNTEHVNLLKMLKNRDGAVNLSIDAQYDSPGFCAMMCKVTAIDAESGYAVGMHVLKKTWSIFENVSGRMEPEGTRRILEEMEYFGVKVDRVTTDRSTTVMAMMRENFADIEHKRDAWHMVKGLKKDLLEEAKKKRSGTLNDFVQGIKNHFWFSIAEAKGDGELCREILLSSLFHIIGVHQWNLGNICSQLTDKIRGLIGRDKKKINAFQQKNPSKCSNFFKTLQFEHITQCCHGNIDVELDDNAYIDPVSNGFFYVLNKLTTEKFLKDVVLLSPDLTTSKVENFHSVASGIYTPKRTYFPFESYSMRSALAILHYNNNERSTKEGNRTILRSVTYPSKSQHGKLVTKKVKSKAPITWKHNIITQCLQVIEMGENVLEDAYEDDGPASSDAAESNEMEAHTEYPQEINEEEEEIEEEVAQNDSESSEECYSDEF